MRRKTAKAIMHRRHGDTFLGGGERNELQVGGVYGVDEILQQPR
jgi:hypothetical protein